MRGNPITYFKGVSREAKRIRWPKRDELFPAIAVVIVINIFAAIFLVLEDLAAGTLIDQLDKAFSLIK